MKKIALLFCATLLSTAMVSAQNPLLQNPVTGNINLNDISCMEMVSNGQNVVLVIGGNAKVFAIDIGDQNRANAAINLVTTIPNFVAQKLTPLVGNNVNRVLDMEVNPLSNSVYVLAQAGANRHIFKVEKNGALVSLLNVTNISYSELKWGTDLDVNDMTFGNNKLYVSSGGAMLNGEVGSIAPPFAHNATFTKRATTMYKSNWGGQYVTTAPLEKLEFGNIGGVNRLMGVTTCAPGFSIDVNAITGAGVLQVSEDFDVFTGMPQATVYMRHDQKDWLFALHDNKLYRIGKKFLDGSRTAANQTNNQSVKLRDMTGNVPATLTADEMKAMAPTATFDMVAFWDNYRLLELETGATGALKLAQVSTENPPAPTGVNDIANRYKDVTIYPNPATDHITVQLPSSNTKAEVSIVSGNGRTVLVKKISGAKTSEINVSNLPAGIYSVITQITGEETSVTQKIIIK
jgi:hypothetical protein